MNAGGLTSRLRGRWARRPSGRAVRSHIAAIPGAVGSRARALAGRPKLLVGIAAILIVAVVGTTIAYVSLGAVYDTPTPEPTEVALASDTPTPTAEPTPTSSPTATPTPLPTPSPTPQMVAATTSGILLPADQADIATRKPIAVMIDDHWGARPQSGLSYADIVYQGPAEGGIPRYMAFFQTHDAPEIGPVRSARPYFVAWAEEYRAIYVHMWGSPGAMNRLATDNGKYIYNIDGLRYGGKSGYMWRVAFRVGPHNLYTSTAKLRSLGQKLGGTAPMTEPLFTFVDAAPASERLIGGSIQVVYPNNRVTYSYDHDTNTYPRSVSQQTSKRGSMFDVDASNEQRIAPTNVILLYMDMGLLPCQGHGCLKHRVDVRYVGSGKAVVFNNGQAIAAVWAKRSEYSPTVIAYASGPDKGKAVPLVRGQIFVQVVPTGTTATWSTGYLPPPEADPLG
jgi:hypothetical protein